MNDRYLNNVVTSFRLGFDSWMKGDDDMTISRLLRRCSFNTEHVDDEVRHCCEYFARHVSEDLIISIVSNANENSSDDIFTSIVLMGNPLFEVQSDKIRIQTLKSLLKRLQRFERGYDYGHIFHMLGWSDDSPIMKLALVIERAHIFDLGENNVEKKH